MTSNREKKAITTFVNTFRGSFKKLDPLDVDYKIFDKNKNLIAYVEVKDILNTMYSSYPLSIDAKKIVKLVDKRLCGVVIWNCDDGIIYGKVNNIKGEIMFSHDNSELIIFYNKQKQLKYIRFN